MKKVLDGLMNIVSGMGTARDRHAHSKYQKTVDIRDFEELEAFYLENWVAQKIVHTVPMDLTREWRRVLASSLSPEQIKDYQQYETEMRLKQRVEEVMSWARLYGGAAIIPILEGQSDLSKQLNLDSVKKGYLKGFNIVDSRFLYPSTRVNLDPFHEYYMEPEYYVAAFSSEHQIHTSRIIKFIGKPLPRYERIRNRYWGLSAIQAVRKTLIEADTGVAACSSLLHEMNVDIVSVKGLATSLAAGQESAIRERMALYHSLKSIWNVVLVDSEEQVNSRQLSLSGMDRLLEQFYKIVSGACDIPYTRLMGQSAAGFNATGESDMRNYYDMLANEQETQIAPALRKIDDIMCRSLFGAPVEDFHFEFHPLWQETAKEIADRRKVEAETHSIYLNNLVVSPSVVASELAQTGVYDNLTIEYLEEMRKDEEEGFSDLLKGGEDETPTDPA